MTLRMVPVEGSAPRATDAPVRNKSNDRRRITKRDDRLWNGQAEEPSRSCCSRQRHRLRPAKDQRRVGHARPAARQQAVAKFELIVRRTHRPRKHDAGLTEKLDAQTGRCRKNPRGGGEIVVGNNRVEFGGRGLQASNSRAGIREPEHHGHCAGGTGWERPELGYHRARPGLKAAPIDADGHDLS